MARNDLLLVDRIKLKWYQPDNENMTNICAIFFSVKAAPIQKSGHLLKCMRFEFWMTEIIILHWHYFNWYQYVTNTNFPLPQVLNA